MTNTNWIRIVYITGIVALLIGVLDPLEGSVVILAGSVFLAFSTYASGDRHRKIFLASAILIAIGVFFMFYLSSRGGIGGKADLTLWWGLLMIPYPAGWLLAITLLIIRVIQKNKAGLQ